MEKVVLAAALFAAIAVGFALPTPGASESINTVAPVSQFAQLDLG